MNMPTDILGSKMKDFPTDYATGHEASTRGYGDNAYQGPSSLTPNQARKVSKQYADLATKTPDLKADASNVQMRTISAKPIATT
jgi:hypothetical protein